MFKRRHIRETAIQFLYFADLEDGPEAADMQETFWQLVQENSLLKHSKAKAKAMLHLTQGRDSRLKKLTDRAAPAEAEIKAAGNAAPVVTALHKIIRQENKLGTAIEAVREAVKTKPGQSPALAIDAALSVSRSLNTLRADWLNTLEDFPFWKNKLEPVTAAIRQLQRISDRLHALDTPAADVADFAHLRESYAEITTFREQTQSLVQNVIRHKQDIDTSLASVVENFSPERIDPVDRAILRLATYEINHCPDIPRPVSINEAIELAKKFGTTDSARFINGVLDAINN